MVFESVISTVEISNNQARKLTKAILNMQIIYLTKIINIQKKIYLEEEIPRNQNNP